MIFLAGLFAMTEQRQHDNKFHRKWVMCPTCRQHTDFGNIAYADDRQDKSFNSATLDAIQGYEKCEASLTVQGSYGSKVSFLIQCIMSNCVLIFLCTQLHMNFLI